MLAIKGLIAIIALVYRGVSWGLEVLIEGLLTAGRTGRTHRTRILECGLEN
jgi:hypothetical protein